VVWPAATVDKTTPTIMHGNARILFHPPLMCLD
jgi:hypothetical protein